MTFSEAVKILRSAGLEVEPSDIPGLTFVGGRELTMNQVRDVAAFHTMEAGD